MKRILVPTDFSSVADNAMDYAIELAAIFNSEILLYHVYIFNNITHYDWDFPDEEQPYVKKIEEEMNSLKMKFEEKITQKGLSIQTIVEEDNIFSLFSKKVVAHDIDLIVMGSKGITGLERVIFGSVTATAIDMSEVPVLVVPPNQTFLPYEQIVLATDLHKVSPRVLSPLQNLASKFAAKLTLLNVKRVKSDDPQPKIDLYFDGVDTSYLEVPMSTSINDSINEFIRKDKYELLCMIRRDKGFFKSIFHKSITKTQAYNSDIPLLVLPEMVIT